MTKTKIAVLVSGGGTNLQALIDAQQGGALPSGEIVLVVSSQRGAYAIERAAKAGIPSVVCNKKELGGTQEAFESAICAALDEAGVELIILAGFMSILSLAEHLDRRETDEEYQQKKFIGIHGMIMEVSESDYTAFYRAKRRQKYLAECAADRGG